MQCAGAGSDLSSHWLTAVHWFGLFGPTVQLTSTTNNEAMKTSVVDSTCCLLSLFNVYGLTTSWAVYLLRDTPTLQPTHAPSLTPTIAPTTPTIASSSHQHSPVLHHITAVAAEWQQSTTDDGDDYNSSIPSLGPDYLYSNGSITGYRCVCEQSESIHDSVVAVDPCGYVCQMTVSWTQTNLCF